MFACSLEPVAFAGSLFERLQAAHLVLQQLAISLLPVEVGGLADPGLAVDLRNRRTFLVLLQNERFLRIGELRCLIVLDTSPN